MTTADVAASDGRGIGAGVLAGMGAGALWGLVFLAPELARAFSPVQLAVGRYLAYGVIAAMLLAPRWRATTRGLAARDWAALGWLALMGNTAYYVLLSTAVQTAGIAITSLVIGFLPVAVTLIGARERDAVPLARLAPSLLLSAVGALSIGWQALGTGASALGFICAIGALACWTTFAVSNSRALARRPGTSAHDWNLLVGIATGVQALALAPLAGWGGHDAAAWRLFAGVSIGVALLASIVGNALWNRMSRLLPLTMTGQMILFETLFALLYGFVFEARWPRGMELAAFALVVASVLSCLAAHRRAA